MTSISGKELKQPVRSVVVANGEELDIAGQCDVTISIGNFSCCYPVSTQVKSQTRHWPDFHRAMEQPSGRLQSDIMTRCLLIMSYEMFRLYHDC